MRANAATQLRTLSQFVRVIEESDLHRCVRGASQETIERNTFPHKYKRVRRQSEIDEDEDGGEKCTICLSFFEVENDVRYVFGN